MFYLHVPPPSTPTPPTTARPVTYGTRQSTPSRPKSAAQAVCVPTMQAIAPQPSPSKTVSPRPAAYVGFSPRVPSLPRPVQVFRAVQPLGIEADPGVQAQKASIRSVADMSSQRRASEPPQSPLFPGVPSSGIDQGNGSPVSSVYHAVTARKTAEETAKQLARRIAHFRAQEEKVLREVQQMKQRLESLLNAHSDEQEDHGSDSTANALVERRPSTARRPLSATASSRMAQRHDLKTPRSREQLQFLTKQRRVIQNRKAESARLQKEKRQLALETQKQKDAAEQNRREALKERIRLERQRAVDQRAALQHRRLDELERQHHHRLRVEQARELEAQRLINEMRDEEKSIALRLQALQLHQDHIKQGLQGQFHSRPASARSSPPRATSSRIDKDISV